MGSVEIPQQAFLAVLKLDRARERASPCPLYALVPGDHTRSTRSDRSWEMGNGRGAPSPIRHAGTAHSRLERKRHAIGTGMGNTKPMNNLVNIIIVLLIVGWLVGFIGFGALVGNLIHILLILAVVAIVFRLVSGGKARL